MGVLSHCFQINISSQFHVFSVDSKNLQSTDFVRHTNIYFSIESTEPSQGWVDGVGSVCGCYHNYMSTTFQAVHQRQKLGDDSPFDLAVHFFSVRGD